MTKRVNSVTHRTGTQLKNTWYWTNSVTIAGRGDTLPECVNKEKITKAKCKMYPKKKQRQLVEVTSQNRVSTELREKTELQTKINN